MFKNLRKIVVLGLAGVSMMNAWGAETVDKGYKIEDGKIVITDAKSFKEHFGDESSIIKDFFLDGSASSAGNTVTKEIAVACSFDVVLGGECFDFKIVEPSKKLELVTSDGKTKKIGDNVVVFKCINPCASSVKFTIDNSLADVVGMKICSDSDCLMAFADCGSGVVKANTESPTLHFASEDTFYIGFGFLSEDTMPGKEFLEGANDCPDALVEKIVMAGKSDKKIEITFIGK